MAIFYPILYFFTLEKYSLLGVRKDYWNFISDCIPKDDGVKVVHAIPQVQYDGIKKKIGNESFEYSRISVTKCIQINSKLREFLHCT